MQNIKSYLKTKQQQINQQLKKFLPSRNRSALTAAMHYAVFSGGKRFRPILMLAVAEALGADPRRILPAACAIEFLHTFTLVHDDLPAMDNDDYRRGKPTCHRVYGEDVAILAGDALQALAFEILASRLKSSPLEKIEIIRGLAEAVGAKGVMEGQVLDLQSEGRRISLAKLYALHQKKTAALIQAAVSMAAKLSGASPSQKKSLAQYALHLGLAFQITDDLLDQGSTFKALGKRPGGDAKKQKATFPKFLGVNGARVKRKEELFKALKALARLGKRAKILADLAHYITQRN